MSDPNTTPELVRRSPRWLVYAGIAGLFLLALALRLFRAGSTPLGGHGDVAWIGINALDWLQHGIWPFYIYELYAPEPVIVYSAALSIATWGASFFASRLPTIVAGALTVPAGFVAARWLAANGGADDKAARRTRWLFALAYAVGFQAIMLSKTGQRAQLFPLELMVFTALFAYGWHSGKRWAFLVSAVVMAFANYTYIPARLMPIMAALWVVHQFFADRERAKARLRDVLLMYALGALLVLPQLIMYVRTPEAFTARADQHAGRLLFETSRSGLRLWGTVAAKVLGEFRIYLLPWTGLYAGYPPRPLMPLVLALGAIAGLVLAFRHGKDKLLWWSLIGIVIMILTDVVSGTQTEPHGLRMIGELPFAFLLGARGLALAWGWLEERVKGRAWASHPARLNAAAGVLLALALAVPSLDDMYLYHFYTVPLQESDPTTANIIEQADIFLTDLVHRHAHDGYPILITWDDFTRANIVYLLTRDYPQRRSGIAADDTLDVPAWDGRVLVLVPAEPYRLRHDGWTPEHDGRSFAMLADGQQMMLPPLKPDAAARLQAQIDAGQPVDTISDWLSQRVGALYLLDLTPDDFDLSMTPVNVSLEGQVELAGYRVDSQSLTPGQPLWITLYWRAQSGAKQDYESFVQLWDTNEQPVSKVHRWTLDGVYRTRLWQPGELVPVRFMLPVPDGLPVGEYSLAVGLFRVLENTPLRVVDSSGNLSGGQIILAPFKVPLPQEAVREPPPPEPITFGGTIALAGVRTRVGGDSVDITADWQAITRPVAAHTLFIHIEGPDGKIASQLDAQPRGGLYPTNIWDPGEVVRERYTVPIAGLPPGRYKVYIGWYTLPGGQRLEALAGGQPVPDNRVLLATFQR